MSGTYNLSRRQVSVMLKDFYNIDISLGSIRNIEARMTKALEAFSDEAMAYIETADVKHVDETGWIRDSLHASAWVFADSVVSESLLSEPLELRRSPKLIGGFRPGKTR